MSLIAPFVLVPLLSVFARSPGLPSPYGQARQLYYQGADGSKQAYAEADTLFTDLYRRYGHEPRIEAYYGSLRLLEASHTWALWKKYSLSKQGIQLMDAAVSAAPDDLEIRFVRAATTYELPGIFHLREQCAQDFAYLAKRAPDAARSGALEPRLAAASLYFHGEFLKDAHRQQAARATWLQAIQLAPASRAARESREALRK